MAHERIQPPHNQPSIIPKDYDWPSLSLLEKNAEDLEAALDQFSQITSDLKQLLPFLDPAPVNVPNGKLGKPIIFSP